eukprot:SAG22_NODE_668_length_7998_cov_4.353462_3_plen_197_part_00
MALLSACTVNLFGYFVYERGSCPSQPNHNPTGDSVVCVPPWASTDGCAASATGSVSPWSALGGHTDGKERHCLRYNSSGSTAKRRCLMTRLATTVLAAATPRLPVAVVPTAASSGRRELRGQALQERVFARRWPQVQRQSGVEQPPADAVRAAPRGLQAADGHVLLGCWTARKDREHTRGKAVEMEWNGMEWNGME